jgi:hypothetical protein
MRPIAYFPQVACCHLMLCERNSQLGLVTIHSSFFIIISGSTRYCGHFWPIVQAPNDRWRRLWSNWWNENWQVRPKYSEKTCPSATLSTTNLTWPDPGSNPGRRGGKPATNRLSYSAAYHLFLLVLPLFLIFSCFSPLFLLSRRLL